MARVVSIHEYQLKPDADRIAFEGIVNLSGVVCCSCRWRGSSGRGTPLLAYCVAPLKPSGAGKRRPQSAKLTMPHHRLLDLDRRAVLQDRLLAADLLQRQLATFVVQLLEPVKAVAAVAHHFAGLADIAELL